MRNEEDVVDTEGSKEKMLVLPKGVKTITFWPQLFAPT